MPGVPRGKCNLYDFGSNVSLLVSWPAAVKSGRRVDDFVSLMDIAPTVLEATQTERPAHMLAKNFMNVLKSDQSGVIDKSRDHVIIGRERHVGEARRDRIPYPSRAIRTPDFLLIRNFKPDRMPMGEVFDSEATAEQLLQDHYLAYPDMDASPTKIFLMTNRDSYSKHFDLAFSSRPEFELYDLKIDPDQVRNVAADSGYAKVLRELTDRMMRELRDTGDPRIMGDGSAFDQKPFVEPGFDPPLRNKKILTF